VIGSDVLRCESSGALVAPPAASDRDREEAALILRCTDGDVEAFRPLVQRYQRVAYSVALRMVDRPADAEDIVQQAFVDAFGAIDRFRGEGRAHAFSTWLLRIVVNRAKDVLKSKKYTEEQLDAEVRPGDAMFAHDPQNPETRTSQAESRRRLEDAFQSLDPKYREVMVLRDVEELPYEAIRQILHLPITTLKIRVVRARAMLRDLLSRDEVVK
jgi:RNA polymerase sigma-70 factor (ECF subfamily)